MRLILMRHAQCHSNVAGRMLGRQDGAAFSPPTEKDSANELTQFGQSQAQALGSWLADHDIAPTHFYSSPLARARQTWALVQQHCPSAATTEIVLDQRLVEIDQGIFSGLTWSEACDRYPELCASLEQSLDWQPVPGAESPTACRARAQALLAQWRERHGEQDCLWVISHGGFLSHLVSEILGCDRTWGCAIPPTSLFEFELELSHCSQTQENRFNTALWKIHAFNSTKHLENLT